MPRTFDRFPRLWRRRADSLVVDAALGDAGADRMAKALDDALGRRDRAERRQAASRVLGAYLTLSAAGRRRFLSVLATRFGTDGGAVDRAVAALVTADPGAGRTAAERLVRQAVTPRHVEFLRLVTSLPGGVKLLVDLRADLLPIRRDEPALGVLDDELSGLLSSLFDVGLIELERITWDTTPAAVLERLIAYEAVHEITGWDDLRHRLDSDRRCYAYFHPAMPGEPLVFVEIALTEGVADKLPPLLDADTPDLDPDEADTAIFYSISNCQPGLAGVALGNELIKQVVGELRRDLPRLKTFATLSPIPGFRAWAEARIAAGELSEPERESIGALVEATDPDWLDRAKLGVLSLCARYLTQPANGRAADQVANFHLSNGASVHRIDWMANPADYGMAASFGLMVNYLYETDRIAANTTAYLESGTIPSSREVRGLVKG